MSPYIRKVTTASGANAVQIAEKVAGQHRIIEHIGSAQTDAELPVLIRRANEAMRPGQLEFDLAEPAGRSPAVGVVRSQVSRLLWGGTCRGVIPGSGR